MIVQPDFVKYFYRATGGSVSSQAKRILGERQSAALGVAGRSSLTGETSGCLNCGQARLAILASPRGGPRPLSTTWSTNIQWPSKPPGGPCSARSATVAVHQGKWSGGPSAQASHLSHRPQAQGRCKTAFWPPQSVQWPMNRQTALVACRPGSRPLSVQSARSGPAAKTPPRR
jgi:hypothetical protein